MNERPLPQVGDVWESKRVRRGAIDRRTVLKVDHGMIKTQGARRTWSKLGTFAKAYKLIKSADA